MLPVRKSILALICLAALTLGLATWTAGCRSTPAQAADPGTDARSSRLVDAEWLQANLGADDLVIIDARTTSDYLDSHLPGAVSASFPEDQATSYGLNVSYGCGLDYFVNADDPIPFQDGPTAQIQDALRSFGIDNDSLVVIYDSGPDFHAARFFWTLSQHGHDNAFLLNGGLNRWAALGYDTTTEIPAVTRGHFVAQAPDVTQIATTDDVFASLSDPNTVVVSGLQPNWHYASYNAYTIPGHIPGATRVSLGYFFNSDGTFKSADDMETLLEVAGVTPQQSVITYCGGGPLSAAVHFSLRHVQGYPDVRNYTISYLGWIADPRDLPVRTYGQDQWLRDTSWLHWWAGERIQRLMPVSPALAVDVRPAADYGAEHIPYAVSLPVTDSADLLAQSPAGWATQLGDLGIDSGIEVVVIDETVTPEAALAVWVLQYLGHPKVSLAAEGMHGWWAAGHNLTDSATLIAEPVTPIDVAIQPMTFTVDVQDDLRLTAVDGPAAAPLARTWLVTSEEVPDDLPFDDYVHVPWSENLDEDGQLRTAGELWATYEDAGLSFFSEIVCYSDDPAEAALAAFVLRLMDFPSVRLYLPDDAGL